MAYPRKNRAIGIITLFQASHLSETTDITFLPALVRGPFYYLYLVEDLYSLKIVAWEVHEREAGELAADLIQQALWREKCLSQRPVLHADNGSAMKSQTLRVKLQDLGIAPSYSRPGVSDDNAFVESVFRTLKYCPKWPRRGFSSLEEARQWTHRFVSWYNEEHQHSKLRFVTPAQRHRQEDAAILAQRHRLYQDARDKHPQRWSGQTRNWSPVGAVALNPVNTPDLGKSAA